MSINRPSRRQLATIAQGDTEIIKALEAIFDAAANTLPASVTTAQSTADAAQVDADAGIANAAAAQTTANTAVMNAATAQAAADAAQADVDARTGFTGTFQSLSGDTVTVSDGLIISVV